jgi:hypothetical protein
MGYFTYRVFRDIPLDRLADKVRANLALYEPGTVGRDLKVTATEGTRCSALFFGYLKHEEALLMPIGYQFGCVWMDVNWNDGDWWDLRIYEGAEHRVGHNPNPWATGDRVKWEAQHFDHRIRRVCELWPHHAGRIRNYLLPARRRVTKLGRTRFVPRTGKAYDTDDYKYGDADQIHDFVAAFGINGQARSAVVSAP